MNEEMKTKLQKYMQDNGYYNLEAIAQDEEELSAKHARFAAIFGDMQAEDAGTTESEMMTAARKHNMDKAEAEDEATKQEQQAEADALLSADAIDYPRAVELGLAELVGDVTDPETRPYYQLTTEAQARRAALNENNDEDELTEVDRVGLEYSNGDIASYIIFKDGAKYTVDAEWSDGPAGIFDHMPNSAEIESIHEDYLRMERWS